MTGQNYDSDIDTDARFHTRGTAIGPVEPNAVSSNVSRLSPDDDMLGSKKLIPVFVAGIGNPKPYLNTLHSAGNIVLKSIAQRDKRYDRSRPFHGGELVEGNNRVFQFPAGFRPSALPTLWMSGSMMNVSGPAVKKAWNAWRKTLDGESPAPRLVIVHDELEKDLGTVSVRTDARLSAKGHNGIKSIQSSLQSEPFIRIGLGIGRPAGRDPGTVSSYVLRITDNREIQALEQAGRKVEMFIDEIVEGTIA